MNNKKLVSTLKSNCGIVSVNIKLQKYYLNMNPHVLRVHLMTRKYTTQNFVCVGGGGILFIIMINFRCLHMENLFPA